MNFFILPAVHLLAVMSPGPDFFLILEQSLLHSRRAGLISAFGIAAGCLIHMFTATVIIAFLGSQIEWVSEGLRILGAGYLIFLGFSSFKGVFSQKFREKNLGEEIAAPSLSDQSGRSKNSSMAGEKTEKKIHKNEFKTYFLKGLFCNLLNPKAWAYFLSVFVAVYHQLNFWEIPLLILLFYLITQAWFSLVTVLFTLARVKARLERYKTAMALLCGIGFWVLGIGLALNGQG